MRRRGFAIVWHYPALATWYELPGKLAEIIATTVVRFAETGAGHIEWVPPYYRLHAGTHDLALVVDREQRILTVVRIYRRR